MKTIGQVISSHRQKQGWSQEKLAQVTQVPLTCIQALEEERFADLPTAALTQGYVQLLAHVLVIPTETALALLRRDLPQPAAQPSLWSKSQRFPLRRGRWWHPQAFSALGFGLLLVAAATFVTYQWRRLTDLPSLEVDTLENQTLVASPLTIDGQTEPQATLTINTEIVSLDPSGKFHYELALPPGERTIVIRATDSRGRQNEAVYFVTVE